MTEERTKVGPRPPTNAQLAPVLDALPLRPLVPQTDDADDERSEDWWWAGAATAGAQL